METWQARILVEKHELDERIRRLQEAITYRVDLENLQRDLMARQLGYMKAYSSTLRDRIAALEEPGE